MNQETKDLLLSKTFWGMVAALFIATYAPAEQWNMDWAGVVDETLAIVAALFSLYGRYTARKSIGSVLGIALPTAKEK